MEIIRLGVAVLKNGFQEVLQRYVSWKRAIAIESRRMGQKILKGCFCVVACATVQYSTDVICFRNCCRDVMSCVYCALWHCVYSLLDVTFRPHLHGNDTDKNAYVAFEFELFLLPFIAVYTETFQSK